MDKQTLMDVRREAERLDRVYTRGRRLVDRAECAAAAAAELGRAATVDHLEVFTSSRHAVVVQLRPERWARVQALLMDSLRAEAAEAERAFAALGTDDDPGEVD